uniref:Cyclic nucleotide-binding domain-containing protein n=1 Tax=Eiseniibacteriota bacterium TaxID=2212470 RepID=A0A832MKZ8_UNCEI
MTLEPILAEVEFFRGMKQEHLALVAGCAQNVRYDRGEFAGRVGDPADKFWVVREGRMALELHTPNRGAITIATMTEGDVVGFSWLLPPYQLRFDVHVLQPTRALMFDGACLRGKCVADPSLGLDLYQRVTRIIAERLEAMSLQLLDVYGEHPIETD